MPPQELKHRSQKQYRHSEQRERHGDFLSFLLEHRLLGELTIDPVQPVCVAGMNVVAPRDVGDLLEDFFLKFRMEGRQAFYSSRAPVRRADTNGINPDAVLRR